MKIAALVPMREVSVRVPFKNRRTFAGEPLYRWIIRALAECARITEIVIDTDSTWIRDDAAREFPSVRVLERPPHLRDDRIPMNDVLLNTVRQIEADWFLQTHSTNPLLTSQTITLAIDALVASDRDSLFSVTRMHTRLWDAAGKPMNHDPAVLLRTQDLPPVFEENSCLYIFTRATLEARKNRIGERPLMFEIAKLEAQDIDEEADFQIAEMLMKQRLS